MVADRRPLPGRKSIAGGLLVGVVLMCLPEPIAGKLRGVIHDGLSPGQCMVAATIPQAVSPRAGVAGGEPRDSTWERQTRYWQGEAARLRTELDELKQIPTWPVVKSVRPLAQPRLRTARVIGWERPKLAEFPAAVLRGGTANGVHTDDLVLTSSESTLDQGDETGISKDDLVLAGRRVIGRIQQTSRWTSTIQPVTDPEFRGQAQIVRLQEGEAILGAEGILAGSENGNCRLLHIDATEPVTEGDLVFTSLRGVPLSPPLFYGTIARAELDSSETQWLIEVTPAQSGIPPQEVLVLELSLARTEEQ